MKRITFRCKLALVLVLCGVTLCGVTAYAITQVQIAMGTIAHLDIFDGPAEVAIRKNTYQPGDAGPWHYHPGPVYVIVTAGTLTVIEGCGAVKQYSAGDAFHEPAGSVHQVTNQGMVPAEFYTTGIVPVGQPTRIVVDGPRCGPPTRRDQCRNGGWMNFNFPRSFANQGDCIRFVEHDDHDNTDDRDDPDR